MRDQPHASAHQSRPWQSLQALKPPDLKVPSTLAKPLLLSLKSGQVKKLQGCKILDALPLPELTPTLLGPPMGGSKAQADPPGLGKKDEGKFKRELSSVCSASWPQIRVAFPFSPEEFVRVGDTPAACFRE